MWWKLLNYLKTNLFSNMKLLKEYREKNVNGRVNCNSFLAISRKYTSRTWKLANVFKLQLLSYPQWKIIITSFCALEDNNNNNNNNFICVKVL